MTNKFFLQAILRCLTVGLFGMAATTTVHAGVLPEDQADAMYHVYQGDGLTVQGPAVLVRKKFGESIMADGGYETDSVTGASIDVRTSGASELKEHRRQWNGGVSYLRGKTTYNAAFMNSTETDYVSDNLTFGITEDMFGDLTTVTLGFTRGWDDVSQNQQTHVEPRGSVDRRSYRLGLSQILTKNFIVNVNYESSAMEGYLQNPYRSVRYGAGNSLNVGFQDEKYPGTRTTNAVALTGRYFLPYRASLKGGYRYFTDSWGIVAHTGDVEYIHPLKGRLSNFTVEGSGRYYTQTRADFYADLFPFIDAQNFLARDKILATFNDWSVRLGGSWRYAYSPKTYGVVSLFVEHIQYNYQDYKNAEVKVAPDAQPLFSFDANVYMLQYSQHF
jgi:Protein of unknown function (DUF3570)